MIKAKKSLGQNFLIDKEIIKKIVDLIDLKNKTVLEVGPGTGNLTFQILNKNPKKLLVIEKDTQLANKLNIKFKNQKMSFFDNMPKENFDFIYEDRRDHPEAKIAGDIIKYENELLSKEKSFSFTIDGMESTTNYYKKNLKYRYK